MNRRYRTIIVIEHEASSSEEAIMQAQAFVKNPIVGAADFTTRTEALGPAEDPLSVMNASESTPL